MDTTMEQYKDAPLIGLIASKNPVDALVVTVQSLFNGGATRVVVVDDGSDDPDSAAVFNKVEAIGGEVLHLKKNVGKAKALRAGFWVLPRDCIIVQTDDDTLAGNLRGPLKMIQDGKTDIVDIRIETIHTYSLIGLMQELDYWMVNAITKRLQDFLRARTWLAGASAMYTYEAGAAIVLEISKSITEDTEGLFRARSRGFSMRSYLKHDAQFLTMVPEDLRSLHKQWLRWTTGNGMLMHMYGFGGGNPRIAAVNVYCWIDMLIPIPIILRYGLVSFATWMFASCTLIGILGAIRLKRARIALIGPFMPVMTIFWTFVAFQGLYRAHRMIMRGQRQHQGGWDSPKRTAVLELATS